MPLVIVYGALLLNLLSISYLTSIEEYKQTWICKNNPEAVDQIFQQFDIPVEMFYKTLENYHKKFTFDTAHIEAFILKGTTHNIELIPIESITDRLAWEDDWTQVYIPVYPLRPHHLWIEVWFRSTRPICKARQASALQEARPTYFI